MAPQIIVLPGGAGLSAAQAVALGLGGLALGGGLIWYLSRRSAPQIQPGGYGYAPGYDPRALPPGQRPVPGTPIAPAPGRPTTGGSDTRAVADIVSSGGGLLATLAKALGGLFGGGGGEGDPGVIDTEADWERAQAREAESQGELERLKDQYRREHPYAGQVGPGSEYGPPAPGDLFRPDSPWAGASQADLDYMVSTGQMSYDDYLSAMESLGYADAPEGGLSFGEGWMDDPGGEYAGEAPAAEDIYV